MSFHAEYEKTKGPALEPQTPSGDNLRGREPPQSIDSDLEVHRGRALRKGRVVLRDVVFDVVPPVRGGLDFNDVGLQGQPWQSQAEREGWTAALARLKASYPFQELATEELGQSAGRAAGAAAYFCPRCQQGQRRRGQSPTFYAYSASFHCHKCAWHGDHLDLLEETRGLGRQEAFSELKRRVDGEASTPPRPRKTAAELEREAVDAAEASARERREKLHKAAQLYASGIPAEESAEATHYLTAIRGLGDAWRGKGLRFLADARFSDGQRDNALLVPLTDATGKVTATQRIALQRFEGEDKRRRETVGVKAGAAWRPYPPAGGVLVLAEGVESALSAAILTGLPAWAAVDAGNLARLELPPEVREVLIAADYDEPSRPFPGPGGTGIAKALEAAARLRGEGRKVTILVPDKGLNDANDALLAGVGLVAFVEGPTEAVGEREAEAAPMAALAGDAALEAPSAPAAAPFDLPDFSPSGTVREARRDLHQHAEEAVAAAYRRAEHRHHLAQNGMDVDAAGLPARELWIATPGLGKSREFLRAAAKHGNRPTLFLATTNKLAAQAMAVFEAARPRHLVPVLYLGREQEDGAGFPLCRRDAALINKASKAGVEAYGTFCKRCPFYRDCAYLAQRRAIGELGDRAIVFTSHESGFHPLPGRFEVVAIDESPLSSMASTATADPDALVNPAIWEGEGSALLATARQVRDGLERVGAELPFLREQVGHEAVLALANHLSAESDRLASLVKDAGAAGAGDDLLRRMVEDLTAGRRGFLAGLLRTLAGEMEGEGEAASSARLDRHHWATGRGHVAVLKHHTLRRFRAIRATSEVFCLDGTAQPLLYELAIGSDLVARHFRAEAPGYVIQCNLANSSNRLIHHPEAGRRRERLDEMARDLGRLVGAAPLVGLQLQVRRAFEGEGLLAGIPALHFAAERGLNDFERTPTMMVVGRELLPLPAIEDQARCFARAAARPLASMIGQDGKGQFARSFRRPRLRAGTYGPMVELEAHIDPLAQAILETKREGGIEQMLHRVRPVNGHRLVVLLTSVPVDLAVDELLTERELALRLHMAAEAAEAVAGQGWFLLGKAAERGGEVDAISARNAGVLRLLKAGEAALRDLSEIESTDSGSCHRYLIQDRLSVASISCAYPKGLNLVSGLLLCRPNGEARAIMAAREAHPGLRREPPAGGVLRLCVRTFGLLPHWRDLPAMMPQYVASERGAKLLFEDTEADSLASLRAELHPFTYKGRGEPGRARPGLWNPYRVADPLGIIRWRLDRPELVGTFEPHEELFGLPAPPAEDDVPSPIPSKVPLWALPYSLPAWIRANAPEDLRSSLVFRDEATRPAWTRD